LLVDLELKSKIGAGGFSNIWEATDPLGRSVAVKIVSSSAAVVSSALDHARALARVGHPNVVAVYSIEKVTDPESGRLADAIVMELLSGETLTARLLRKALTQNEVSAIGMGILEGIAKIHGEGLTHGDLHADNVMVDGALAKIIDLLYTDSLSLLSNASKDARLRKDIVSIRMMLTDIMLASELDPGAATEFNGSLGP
jgi:serine/threonine protein kinase